MEFQQKLIWVEGRSDIRPCQLRFSLAIFKAVVIRPRLHANEKEQGYVSDADVGGRRKKARPNATMIPVLYTLPVVGLPGTTSVYSTSVVF
jgi:hypothetical protein